MLAQNCVKQASPQTHRVVVCDLVVVLVVIVEVGGLEGRIGSRECGREEGREGESEEERDECIGHLPRDQVALLHRQGLSAFSTAQEKYCRDG